MTVRTERSLPLPDGTRLWATWSGDGPPVVFCHGGPGMWDYLGPLAGLLADRITAIRYEQRGCGRSSGADGPFTIAQAIDDLDRLRAGLGIERCFVLGHSWGAELALRYAAAYPRHTVGVIYLAGVGAGDGFRDAFAEQVRRRRTPAQQRQLAELSTRERTPDEEHERCLLQWSSDFSPTGDPHAHAEALWRTRPPGVSVNARAQRELWADRDSSDLLKLARTVRVPVRMLFGADDPRPWRAADDLYAALPDARRVVLEGAGHSPWAERPEQTRQFILDAVDGAR